MTDNFDSQRSGSPDGPVEPPAPPPAPEPAQESTWQPPNAASGAAKSGSKRPIIIIGAIVVFLAVVLFAVRNNVSADDLKVGDCFNIPNGTSIQTVEKQPCTESHNAEVIFVGDYTDGTTYPISLSLDRFIEGACVPAFETYVGRAIDSEPVLSIGYFYPSIDGWNDGDRTISCYVSEPDEGPMTESLKG